MSVVIPDGELLSRAGAAEEASLFDIYLESKGDAESEGVQWNLTVQYTYTVGIGALLGAGVGVSVKASLLLPGPLWIAALIGGSVGAGVGHLLGVIKEKQIKAAFLHESGPFLEWQMARVDQEAFKIFQQYIKDDPSFINYICAISHELPLVAC